MLLFPVIFLELHVHVNEKRGSMDWEKLDLSKYITKKFRIGRVILGLVCLCIVIIFTGHNLTIGMFVPLGLILLFIIMDLYEIIKK